MVKEAMEQEQDQQKTAAQGDVIRAFDQEGREVSIPREEWRSNVIPNMVKEAWSDPERLYLVIANSLNEGFAAEVAEAAAHLRETDPIPGRGVCISAAVLMATDRRDDAEELLTSFAAKHEDGSVLVNLAQLYAGKGESELATSTLWHALEVEPNHDIGVSWIASQAQAQGGDDAARQVLERIRSLPGSWRAQLWLARGELNAQNLGLAKRLYAEALNRGPRPVPTDFLMQVSGDLGAKNHLSELIELTAPHFVPEAHGLPVGNNLIKAWVDTGDLLAAEQVTKALWSLNRPEWKEALSFWDAEIGRRRVAAAPDAQQLQVGMLRIDGPIWLPQGSPAAPLFPTKNPAAPTVTFLGGSAEAPGGNAAEAARRADAIGRMSRSLPLFLAEQVEMRTAAAGRSMLPWAVAPVSGFVISGQQWPDESAVQAVQVPANASDYVVTVHLDAEVAPWTAMLAFIRTSDGSRIGEVEREFLSESPEEGISTLADEVVELLSVLGATEPATSYRIPAGEGFSSYLLRLEQLLAVRCASMDNVPATFLQGEQQILEDGLHLCLADPSNLPARLLLLNTHEALSRLRPAVAAGFADKIADLSDQHPLAI